MNLIACNNKFVCLGERVLHLSCVLVFIILFFFQINLRLILVSGKTKEFLFSPSESAGDIAQHVFENWPEGECLIRIKPE